MNVLGIGCHPDDLEIGCGGTLAKYAKQGNKVFMCHIANGNMGHALIQPAELREIRDKEARNAAKIIGAVSEVLSLASTRCIAEGVHTLAITLSSILTEVFGLTFRYSLWIPHRLSDDRKSTGYDRHLPCFALC
jgi:LmbE family N-acetylglucosaminyl deacetylase